MFCHCPVCSSLACTSQHTVHATIFYWACGTIILVVFLGIKVWNVKPGWGSRPDIFLEKAHEAGDDVTGLCFSADGHTLLSRSTDSTLKVSSCPVYLMKSFHCLAKRNNLIVYNVLVVDRYGICAKRDLLSRHLATSQTPMLKPQFLSALTSV